VGQCIEVVTTPQQCQALCSADSACRAFQLLPLQLDSSAGKAYGEFPASSFIPWAQSNAFCDKTQFANSPKSGSMACYPIYQFQDDFNSARPLWSFTDDIDHQGFYGTCYIKPRSLQFLTYPQVAADGQTTFRYHSKCIPCDNIGQDLTNPRWGPQQQYCTDCSKTPATPRSLPAVPTWTYVANGTFTGPVRWLSPGGSPFAFQDECIMLTLRDPLCSKYVMYSDTRAQRLSGSIPGLLPTNSAQNVNGTFAFYLVNYTQNWHYTPFSLSFPYYGSCACLAGTTPANSPPLDSTGVTTACAGVSTAQCKVTGFSIYKLP